MRMRPFWVIVHRWAGLTIALFLAVAGLTGSLLVFNDELDAMAAPGMHYVAPPYPGAAMLDPQILRDRVMARHQGGVIEHLPLRLEPGRSVILRVERIDRRTGNIAPWSSDWDELFVDPYSGKTIGHRQWGDIRQGMVNIMPFLYRVHYSFALGSWGLFAFGVAALVWTLDCFVGFYLTLPVRQKIGSEHVRRHATQWWSRWRQAWLVRWQGGSHRLTFDLHRAGGLWVWLLLLVFAWSGVFFNLSSVYNPVMRIFGYESLQEGIVPPPAPRYRPGLDFRAAEAVGQELAHDEAFRRGLIVEPTGETALLHRPNAGIYVYIFTSSADMRMEGGRSLAIFDSDTGRLVKFIVPRGQNGANTFTEWISAIHMVSVWGLSWRIATAILGLMVTMLSLTGVLLWSRKRMARLVVKKRSTHGRQLKAA